MGFFGTAFYLMNSSTRAGLLAGNAVYTLVQNARTKRDIRLVMRKVSDSNLASRDVTVMKYVNRQQLLLTTKDDNDVYLLTNGGATPGLAYINGNDDDLDSCAVSGGRPADRALALLPFVRKMQKASVPIVAIHNGNSDLNAILTANTATSEIVSRQGAAFDPFRSLPDNDVAEILFRTMPDGTPACAQSLLRAIVRMSILTKGASTLQTLSSYPVTSLMSNLNQWKAFGMIQQEEYQEISADYMSGSTASDAVRAFLLRLNRQTSLVFGGRQGGSNLKKMIRSGGIEIYDMGKGINDEVLSLLLNYLLHIREAGRSFALLVEGCPISRHEPFRSLLDGSFAISGSDLVSALSGGHQLGTDLFTELMGGVGVTVLFCHPSGTSCKRWSDHIGTYHKLKLVFTISQSNSFLTSNDNRGIDVRESDEPRIRPDTISKLSGAMACICRPQGILIANVELASP